MKLKYFTVKIEKCREVYDKGENYLLFHIFQEKIKITHISTIQKLPLLTSWYISLS